MNHNILIKILSVPVFLMGLALQSVAQGDLLLTPTRVVFEGNKQKQELNLVNIGKDTATYSISFIQYNMKEDGSFALIDKPDTGQMFADPYLRIFPRKVTLAPGEPQVIMLQCRRKTDMAAGEYRSHLYFRSEISYKPLDAKNIDTANSISVQLVPVFGMAIPVIIRSGTVTGTPSLSSLKLETVQKSVQTLKLTINRSGNSSVYGDIIIDFIPAQGKSFQIGAAKGIGVYTNITKRNISVKLDDINSKPLSNGKLRVQYVSCGETKRIVYAEAEMVVK